MAAGPYDLSGFSLLENAFAKMFNDQVNTPSLFAGNAAIAATYSIGNVAGFTGSQPGQAGFAASGPATVTTQLLIARLAAIQAQLDKLVCG